jgi:hypothetical protein
MEEDVIERILFSGSQQYLDNLNNSDFIHIQLMFGTTFLTFETDPFLFLAMYNHKLI